MAVYNNHQEYYEAIVVPSKVEKPTVRYCFLLSPDIQVGDSISIIPIDHPAIYLNKKVVHTSAVVSVDGMNFETRNTKYVFEQFTKEN